MKKILIPVITVLLSACATLPMPLPAPTTAIPMRLLVEENSYRPQPEDLSLRLAGVELTNTSLLERFDLDPFRVELKLSGSLPSSCNQLRVDVAKPNDTVLGHKLRFFRRRKAESAICGPCVLYN